MTEQRLVCRCGKYQRIRGVPAAVESCSGCPECGTTYGDHRPLEPHQWVIKREIEFRHGVLTRDVLYRQCVVCRLIQGPKALAEDRELRDETLRYEHPEEVEARALLALENIRGLKVKICEAPVSGPLCCYMPRALFWYVSWKLDHRWRDWLLWRFWSAVSWLTRRHWWAWWRRSDAGEVKT